MNATENILKGILFISKAHNGVKRKYTGEPYTNHCVRVAQLSLDNYDGDAVDDETLVLTALLHDTIEDTKIGYIEIIAEFGEEVAEGVKWLTNLPLKEPQSRKERVLINMDRLSKAPGWVQTIKCADILDNLSDIEEQDPDFAKYYFKEKNDVTGLLLNASKRMWAKTTLFIRDYYN